MKDGHPRRLHIPCKGSAEIPVEQQLEYPVDAGVVFDGEEVHVDCTLAVGGLCTAAKSGTHPCTTGVSIREAHAQFFSH